MQPGTAFFHFPGRFLGSASVRSPPGSFLTSESPVPNDGGVSVATVPVPEPSTMALAAIGLAGAGLAFRRHGLMARHGV